MPNFIDRLSDRVELNRAELRETLTKEARPEERELQRLVKKHWHRLPKATGMPKRPAYAVDGSRAVRHLANGAYLFVAQALVVGERDGQRVEDAQADVRILSGATPTFIVEPFAELMMHRLEAELARERVTDNIRNAVIFLDGALYGQLSQLFGVEESGEDGNAETKAKSLINQAVKNILESYKVLFDACRGGLTLVSIAKTSHVTTHSQIWWRHAAQEDQVTRKTKPIEISDSEIIYRWTDQAAGFSTPVLLGKHSFSRGRAAVLMEEEDVRNAPAILSFFVRPSDFDDALRIDVPACCIGRNETIDDIESGDEKLLDQPADLAAVEKILQLLMSDYGGPEVYNALMYSVDREVRLRQDMMDEVYLSLIQNTLGADVELRLDRSERRFHARQ